MLEVTCKLKAIEGFQAAGRVLISSAGQLLNAIFDLQRFSFRCKAPASNQFHRAVCPGVSSALPFVMGSNARFDVLCIPCVQGTVGTANNIYIMEWAFVWGRSTIRGFCNYPQFIYFRKGIEGSLTVKVAWQRSLA